MARTIFQLDTDELNVLERITADEIYDKVNECINNVYDSGDSRKVSINLLISEFPKGSVEYNEEDESILFKREEIQAGYFKGKYEKFKNYAANITYDEFSGKHKTYSTLYELEETITSNNGYYIYNGWEPIPLDEFVRELKYPEVRYYVGGIFDYRF